MARPRRVLFWRVYLTLLASLALLAVLGATGMHLMVGRPIIHPGTLSLRGHFLAVLLVVAGVVGLAAWPVIAAITRRLEALRLAVESWGEGQADRRASLAGGDEIAAVAASFNAAADRAGALLAAHKSLLAHASHELRSPLARLALASEMMLAAPSADLAAAIGAEIAELDGLVEEILLASRLDHVPLEGESERVDLLALAAEEAARAGVALRAVPQDAPPFEVAGSPRLLRRLIRNLIENARAHGGPPIEVELGRLARDGRPILTLAVHDHGPGIPEALRDQVFEPFWRPQGWSEAAGSWGLGLALVRQIAHRHAGAATCPPTPAGVTTFLVELPAAEREKGPLT